DCSFEGSIQSKRGFFGGFIGWADSAEVFSNCHVRATYAPDGLFTRDATGGFAGVVSSAGAEFVDCSAESLGGGTSIDAGFFSSQQPVVQNVSGIPYTVGTNSFLRCSTKNMTAYNAGFCSSAWNCSFRGCSVRGVASNGAGFVGDAGDPPGSDGYPYEQSSLFEDCSVVGARAGYGFAHNANHLSKNGSTNVFRRCRASGTFNNGFGALGKGSTAEDCAVVGMSAGSFEAGFAGTISTGATVRRCVGALMPLPSETFGAGFADSIGYDSVVEDCYSVYAPTAAAIYNRQEGGFVRSTTLGISSSSATSSGLDKIARCFTLGAIPATGCSYIGSFCGGTPEYPYGATYDVRFEDCYRPAESPVGDFSNQDHAGVAAFTRAEFANATAATMPNYDFEHVWRAPGGDASSPYLKASTDENGNFWFYAEPPSGTGFILVNDEAPREAYPAGARIKVKAVGNGLPFTGWIGEGFDDPTAQETWYTVRNVSAIGATFGTPIYTVDDFTNLLSSASTTSKITGNYVLMNDLDFTGVVEPQQYATSVSVDNFQGKFFGQGHTISGLCTTKGTFNTTFALFRKVSAGAEIRDLTVISSNVPSDENPQNTLSLAGLAVEVGSGVTISNCHAVVDWQGVYPASYENYAYASCLYYGLARTVSGSDIHIVDCTVRGRLAGGTQACGFVGSASLTGGEIARCAVLADVSTLTNRTDGLACGFAGSISLSGGATIRECFSAGVADGAGETAGFVYEIQLDAESSIRDCYSTMEVVSRENSAAGFAYRLYDNSYNYEAGVSNLWFGGSVRSRPGSTAYGFAYYMSYVNLVNCYRVKADAASSTAGVTDIVPAAARQTASWTGFDFENTWSLTEGATTPYFAWSLTDAINCVPPAGGAQLAVPAPAGFRLFAENEPGTVITHPDVATPGS
ncbi:MAG: hypothetical protein J6V72_17720, partial [Kiritimatiellae bacterium]|nr:hypothetical protein [Kiritimatiellia bacterium]